MASAATPPGHPSRGRGRVFVAGATGVIGRRVVPRLVAAGYEVSGVARRPAAADALRSAGATPVVVDLFDAGAVRVAVAGHDAVVNLATHIPPLRSAARASAWDENARLRREASRNLVDAALASGAGAYVQESVAFMYPEAGDDPIDETAPLDGSPMAAPVAAAEAQAARVTAAGGRGVVLRFGRFVAPDSDQVAAVVRAAGFGVFAEPGRLDAYVPLVHVDDAAAAVVVALDAPAGTYHVAAEPVRRDTVRSELSVAVGRRLRPLPAAAGRLGNAALLARSQRVVTGRLGRATGWEPEHDAPGAWRGVVDVRPDLVRPVLRPVVRLLLWLLVLSGLVVGLHALVWPHSFWQSFPLGRGWVAADGPYNEHLVRDVGALNLALAAAALGALVVARRGIVRAVAVAWLVYSVPHLAYHAAHLEGFGGGDAVALVVSVAAIVVAPAALLVVRPEVVRPPAATAR